MTDPLANQDPHATQPHVNPHGFVRYPEGHIYGFVDEPTDDIPRIIADMLGMALPADAINIYCCRPGVEEIAPTGAGYGLKARIQRLVQQLGYEGEMIGRVERELNAGHGLIGVAVDDDTKGPVAALLHRHGAHDIHFYGRFTIQEM